MSVTVLSVGMSNRPSTLSKPVTVGVGVLCLLIVAYSLVVAQQILLGVIACALVLAVAVAFRLVAAMLRFVAAVERGADALESMAQNGSSPSHARDDGARNRPEDRW